MAVQAFQFYSHCNCLCFFLLKGGPVSGCHQLFLGLLLKFLHFWGYKLLHLCVVLYLNQSVFVGAHRNYLYELTVLLIYFLGAKFALFWMSTENGLICFVTSTYYIPAPERLNSFMVFLLSVKRWTTSDKATALGDFCQVTRLCQSQATDLR